MKVIGCIVKVIVEVSVLLVGEMSNIVTVKVNARSVDCVGKFGNNKKDG